MQIRAIFGSAVDPMLTHAFKLNFRPGATDRKQEQKDKHVCSAERFDAIE